MERSDWSLRNYAEMANNNLTTFLNVLIKYGLFFLEPEEASADLVI
jgi:hypothetical protein